MMLTEKALTCRFLPFRPAVPGKSNLRWPLRNQILVPVLLLLLATVGLLTGLNFYLASGTHSRRVEENLSNVANVLSQSTFPLKASVLRDMKLLSGADFVVLDEQDQVVATTLDLQLDSQTRQWLSQASEQENSAGDIGQILVIDDATFYHRSLQRNGTNAQLHLLLREESYRELWWRSVWPSMLVGLIVMPIVALVATGLAALVTRPMARLQHQVDRVADGDWEPLAPGQRNDELRDLAEAVNRMTQQLKAYDAELRKTERLETAVHLGSGIAHHMRNAATGCRMAIQLCQLNPDISAETSENLQVAIRQLALMDKYIQRFLSLDKRSPSGRQEGAVDWLKVGRDVLELLGPSARHLGVQLEQDLPQDPAWVDVPIDDLEQVLMNLVTNALDAAVEGGPASEKKPKVAVDFQRDSTYGVFRVWDSGAGPPADIQATLFDSFVTRKRNGVGLGLYLTREIVERHGGKVDWVRTADAGEPGTRFEVRLPLNQPQSNRKGDSNDLPRTGDSEKSGSTSTAAAIGNDHER